ncbi:hypothetical protein Hypma_002828 [Hypsizygus marmoreus]|uniref:Uncharacterized protein n=1 Tax=Hypsizygus marmoreus TaxID=39966 RepID=A0A369J843_HYPMA|nr:hypothetical protein Hypma_002828 [Hypsizygus marmoreus]
MASTDLAALIIALVALVISLLHVIQQYASSSMARAKVDRAAIGPWAKKNRYGWSFREWRIRVAYARPDCTADEGVSTMGQRSLKQRELMAASLPDFNFSWGMEIVDGPRGPQKRSSGKLTISRKGDESQTPVARSQLTWRQRMVVADLEKSIMQSHERIPPCKATWCNLMTDLGIDPVTLTCDEYVDADTIATALDNPTMFIQISDLICFGFILDMEVAKFDIRERIIDMIGKHCNITTQHQQGVGMLTRYSGMGPKVQPSALGCSSPELSMLLRLARGIIHVGDALADMTDWGYNSVDHIFGAVWDRAKDEEWQEISIGEIMKDIEPDTNAKWMGRWKNPTVPVTAFLLTLTSNAAVAIAFPHRFLKSWSELQRQRASQLAAEHIQNGVGFIEAPTNFLKTMKAQGLDLLIMDDFKTANNWGCEFGGVRGWLISNFAEFSLRMSKCWVVSSMTNKVPVMPQIRPYFADGTLNAKWGRNYNANLSNEDRGDGWRMRANSLLWLQIMFFDAWIARRVELIIKESASADVGVPVDFETATRASMMAANNLQVSGWKKSRLIFTRHYLARLAEGVDGKGASCMSSDEKLDPTIGWAGMPVGNASDWADVDAVLTLRAVTLVARLELMKDSIALVDLRELDPMVQMA